MTPTSTRSLTAFVAGLLSLSLLACASHRPEDTATADAKPVAATEASAADPKKKKEKKEPGPKALGYAIMNKEGEPLYCRRLAVTGSNVVTTTKCLTARQWQQVNDNDQQTFEELRRETQDLQHSK